METIAFVNLKGGCGKSTSVANIAVALAKAGKTVLVVDLDGSCAASHSLGITRPDWRHTGMAALLGAASIGDVTYPSPYVVSVLPGHALLAAFLQSGNQLELAAAAPNRRVKINPAAKDDALAAWKISTDALRLAMQSIPPGKYDYVLIDGPAGNNAFTVMALVAADRYVAPCLVSTQDWDQTLRLVNAASTIAKSRGRPLCAGVLPAVSKTYVPDEWFLQAARASDVPLFSAVRESKVVRTLPTSAGPVVARRPKSPAAFGYIALAEEIMFGIDEMARRRAEAAQARTQAGGGADELTFELDELTATADELFSQSAAGLGRRAAAGLGLSSGAAEVDDGEA